ncbi:MAG: hypothetical protein ACNI3C_08765 [Candidatus Marinarcus sp.]|uniref:hypothetical protein n=1 Tax=Candidatus Marinarcus sp. TaxID=3100987 RepID=UPI003B00FCD6
MNFYTLIFKKKLSYKSLISRFLIFTFIFINIIALLNFLIDPLRMFSHSNRFNNMQSDFDERQQKTNNLYFVKSDYNNLILGSSRSTYLNQNYFYDKTFNYSANGMSPYEYEIFIDNFAKITKKDIKKIIIGIDFFGTAIEKNKDFIHENYLKNSMSFMYRYKNLYNLKLAKYSIKNIRQNFKTNKAYYSRDNVKFTPPNYVLDDKKKIINSLVKFKQYEYDYRLKEYYFNLKNKYKNSEFIIFTMPITVNQLEEYEKNGLLESYFQWLNDLVEVFGEVNHFAYPNKITQDLSYFFDAGHALPKISIYMADFIMNNDKQLDNFGIKLTKENFNSFKKNYKLIKEE